MSNALAFPLVIRADLLPETRELLINATAMAQQAKHITIDDVPGYEVAAGELAKIKAAIKSIDEQRKAITKPLDDAKTQVMDYVRPFTTSLTDAEALIKGAMVRFNENQEAERRRQEAIAAEEARKQQEKLLAKAEKLEEKGKVEQADNLRDAAYSVVAAPSAVVPNAKVAGVSTRHTYGVEVVDLMALVQAVAAGTAPIQALQADTKFLGTQAKAFKEAFNFPGCKLTKTAGIASRAAK